MEFRQLRYALAAIRHGSFRGAAESLGIDQSLVGKSVRTLENRIGITIFERSPRGIRPTEAGKAFLARIAPAMEQIELAQRTAALAGRVDQGTVRIGVIASISTGFLYDLLLRFSKRHASVRLVVSDGSMHENIELVQSRRIDIAFLIGEPAVAGCETLPMWGEDAYIAVSNTHELVQADTVAWEDLAQEHFIVTRNGSGPVVHDFLIRKLSDFASRVEIEPMDVTRDIMLGLVGMGRGISLVGEAATGIHLPGLIFRPIAGAQDSIPYSAIWSKENDNYAFRRLLSFAKIMAGKERRAIAKLLKGAAD
ncbi:LysR family transcriptional regulator [Mesorhizobium sp. PUT5]|uniref:LysR family transcriptional regulator n=1 Tax=Mesorhizobium sp. PUT5 TaxID=3454629 RepID=UPI003FA42922